MTTRVGVRHFLFAIAALLVVAAPSSAQDRLCDPANEDCRAILIGYMDAEPEAMDIAFWFMEDARYTAAIDRARRRGVRVRVFMDPRANTEYPLNATRLAEIQSYGVPMRKRLTSYILHWKMMLFRGLGVVEFSGANYSANALRYEPTTGPYVNYVDEAIYFTSDPAIVNSFREKLDDSWVDTVNWANYANITGPLTREEPDGTYVQAAEMNFPPEQNYRTRALQRYNAARLASNGRGIDVIMYRITDQQHTNAMIAAEGRGVPVRLITEQAQYRLVSRMWHSWNVDRLYMAGIQIRDRAHAGLNHQKSVILHDQDSAAGDQRLAIFGSSNWTSPSAGGQVEHNMFTSRPYIVSWFIDQFERKWNNLAPADETKAFAPLPPDAPTNPVPATGTGGVATSLTLKWFGGPWAHLYDLYLGTSPNPTTLIAANLAEAPTKTATSTFSYVLPMTLNPGTTYYWKVVGKTMANMTRSSPVWTFTTAGDPPPVGGDEVVLYASEATLKVGGWVTQADTTAAGGSKIRHPNAGAPKLAAPLANPAHYFEMTFNADAGRPYRLWIRGRADGNYWGSDSVFVQFNGSVTSASGGTAIWRIGTTSATEFNLEDCSGCGLSAWGWQDNGWGVGVMGQPVYFATTGPQTIRIQTREDGLAIDQIVLSPEAFLNSAPGGLKNDNTILPKSN
jgi:phosphatidylserine/phosphatidylglycerophosphate/cardiolipin synthase-like enzyme